MRARNSEKQTRLEPRLMDLLLLFAGSQGRVLAKNDIIESVWGGRAVGDDTLAGAISRLRSALGETAENRYIETVPKRGYRLVCAMPPQKAVSPGDRETSPAARYLRVGEAALRIPLATGLAEARNAFEAAISEEPSLAPAHAGLAETLLAQHLGGASASVLLPAKTSALAAIGLDSNSAKAWAILGMCKLLVDRSFEAADEDFLHALVLDPQLIPALLGRAYGFASLGRFVEAERECRKAVELDPLSAPARNLLLQVLIAARRYQAVITAAKAAARIAPHGAESWYAKGWANIFLGDEAAGIEAFIRGLELWGLPKKKLAQLSAAFGERGFVPGCAAAADLFEEQGLLFQPRTTDIAILRVASHEFDLAIAALERALRHDDPFLLFLPWLPHFDQIRNDSRFGALVARIRPVR